MAIRKNTEGNEKTDDCAGRLYSPVRFFTEHYPALNDIGFMRYSLMCLQNNLLFFFLTLFTCCNSPSTEQTRDTPSEDLAIHSWYGDELHYGQIGMPQRWINILGNVQTQAGLQSLTYTVNGGKAVSLSVGKDGRRLANHGDFNIDIDTALLAAEENKVLISATDSSGNSMTREITVHYEAGNTWPLPYSIDWDKTEEIEDVAQIVDGHWQLEANGVRTLNPYYDRVLALGDATWRDYEVTTTVMFHSFTPPNDGPPTFGVSHVAIATRWPGHDVDDAQPHIKWHPLGATAEFRLTHQLDSCRWRIFDGENIYVEDSTQTRNITMGKLYQMKHRVETLADSTTRFSVKLWEADRNEPEYWDLQAREKLDNVPTGSALLIAHNTDVTFGNIQVIPLP